MGHLWFQTANDTIPLGYLATVADLDEAAQYDWGSAILASLYHVSEIEEVLTAKLLSRKRMPLQVPNGNCEYNLEDRCWRLPVDRFPEDGNIDMFKPTALRVESTRDAQRLQELTDEVATLRSHLDSADNQLYVHDLHLRKGHDVRVVPLPVGGGVRTRQCGYGPRTREGGTSRRGWGTGDDSE
ncbi:hypothetical protein GIB67_042249 [Kingdonia uniflora]|uniref:Uncharacterized protein n=1 Tax=Kingdonia uniflora TaxID=39325 RepID=A0A7J7LDV2_9MAGN|nr:hypothetical protein GIB67_042249 [Kingdonia uniflora]